MLARCLLRIAAALTFVGAAGLAIDEELARAAAALLLALSFLLLS